MAASCQPVVLQTQLVLSSMRKINESMELSMWNLVWIQIITISTDSIWNSGYKSTITNSNGVKCWGYVKQI